MSVQPQTFRSAVTWWLFAIILVLQLGALTAVVKQTGPGPAALVVLGSIVLVGSLLAFTHYTITPDELVVRSSFLRWRVPLAAIDRVWPAHNPLSAPALSLNRLAIHYGRFGFLLISPQDRTAFVGALLARNPAIRVGPPLA